MKLCKPHVRRFLLVLFVKHFAFSFCRVLEGVKIAWRKTSLLQSKRERVFSNEFIQMRLFCAIHATFAAFEIEFAVVSNGWQNKKCSDIAKPKQKV